MSEFPALKKCCDTGTLRTRFLAFNPVCFVTIIFNGSVTFFIRSIFIRTKMNMVRLGQFRLCGVRLGWIRLHCFKWLKFHFPALEKPRLFAEFLMHIRWIIFLRPQPDFFTSICRIIYVPSICVKFSVHLSVHWKFTGNLHEIVVARRRHAVYGGGGREGQSVVLSSYVKLSESQS